MPQRLPFLALLVTLTSCLISQPRNVMNVCDMFEDRRSWYEAAAGAEQRWNVPISVSMAFIYQESAFESRARPARTRLLWVVPWVRPSDAFGYPQALDSTWDDYREATGNFIARRADFGDAVDFIGWYNANSYRRNNIELNDARNLYLAYHEGNTGFERRTYDGKQWLLDAADRVQRNADRYESQLTQCRDALEMTWFGRLLD